MSELQFQLDFEKRLPPSAQTGMAACDANADPVWRRYIDGCIQAVARRTEEFTVDEVLAELEKIPKVVSTHNLAALGPRMKEVSKVLGYMVATDQVRRSKRPTSHGNLLRVWKSKIYQAEPQMW
jgi:hypothetical protein